MVCGDEHNMSRKNRRKNSLLEKYKEENKLVVRTCLRNVSDEVSDAKANTILNFVMPSSNSFRILQRLSETLGYVRLITLIFGSSRFANQIYSTIDRTMKLDLVLDLERRSKIVRSNCFYA